MGDRPFFAEVPPQLKQLADRIESGPDHYEFITVRDLLSWFGASRRSWRNIKRIREALDELGLTTDPDFEGEHIDADVILQAKKASRDMVVEISDHVSLKDAAQEELTERSAGARIVELADPAHRISRLASARTPPAFVSPTASIREAITLMLCHDYSQLPVMQSDRQVKGLFSWKSYGSRLAAGKQCVCVQDAMDKHQEMPSGASLFDAVKMVAEHDCVLIRADDNKICGIVTAYDISRQFGELAQPFLLLGDVENHIRHMIGGAFTPEELQYVKDPQDETREIKDAFDLTFGEYVRLLENESNWTKLNIEMDRRVFVTKLDRVREIRNEVMHFNPDPLDTQDLKLLEDFVRFLGRWQQITS